MGPRAVRGAALLLAAALVLVGPAGAAAQVFIASHPKPEFRIGPLFVSTSVTRADATGDDRPLRVTVAWSLVLPRGRPAADIAQDLYLLWPGELAGTAGAAGADTALVDQVQALGFGVKASGRLRLAARSRSDMGTRAELKTLGQASFVTFGRAEGPAAPLRGASYIRIPWTPELASLDWLVRLELPAEGLVTRRRVTWLEDVFWGPRYVITLGFGDVGYMSLYPLYFGARDRVVPLARDFSLVLVNFADARHLKVDEAAPPSVTRRMSETRKDTEAFQLPIIASEGLVPQLLKVRFSYFAGRLPWRPILISALFLGLGNLTGPLVAALVRRAVRALRARVQVGRGVEAGRGSGEVPPREVLERIRPGQTTYEEVLRLCGRHAEEQERLPAGEARTLLYRGQRLVPHRRWSLGWLAAVSYWDVEDHEVQIDFEHDRVRDVQARVRRSRLSQAPGA